MNDFKIMTKKKKKRLMTILREEFVNYLRKKDIEKMQQILRRVFEED